MAIGLLCVGRMSALTKSQRHELKNLGLTANRSGVETFQAARGIAVTGAVDATTAKQLGSANTSADRHPDFFVAGMKDNTVLAAEKRLRGLGYDTGKVDGVFDQATAAAVQTFKANHPALRNLGAYMGRPTEHLLAKDTAARAHGPEHVRLLANQTHRRLDAATAAAVKKGELTVGASKSRALKNVEQHLKTAGFDPQNTDGVFDARTESAVKAFQAHSRLPVTGSVDAKTWSALKGAYQYGKNLPMTKGERSSEVRGAQKTLKQLGYEVKVDGVFDAATLRASRAFEKKNHGYGTDGAIGTGQLTAMKQEAARGKGADAFDVAKRVVGKAATWLQTNGPIARFMDDGVDSHVNCANFVSACLQKAGLISGSQHSDRVEDLAKNLAADKDFKSVSLKNAKPGDVCVVVGGDHVVMFAGWKNGQAQFIGSNNDYSRGGAQYVSIKPGYSPIAIYQYQH